MLKRVRPAAADGRPRPTPAFLLRMAGLDGPPFEWHRRSSTIGALWNL